MPKDQPKPPPPPPPPADRLIKEGQIPIVPKVYKE